MTDGDMHEVSLTVNGVQYDETVESRWSLAGFSPSQAALNGNTSGLRARRLWRLYRATRWKVGSRLPDFGGSS